MMTVEPRHVTGGVDAHADVHVAAVLDSATGRRLGVESFPADTTGYAALHAWVGSFGTVDTIGVESTGAWGVGLARHLLAAGVKVIEVDRPDRKARRREGKSDPIDAEAASTGSAIGPSDGDTEGRRRPRRSGLLARGRLPRRRPRPDTRAINQFKALLVTAPADLRERLGSLPFGRQLDLARRFRGHDDPVEAQLRFSLKTLARKIAFLDEQIS